MPWAGTAHSVMYYGGNSTMGRVFLGTAAGFGVSSNTWIFLGRVYFGGLWVIDNSWVGALLAMLSIRNIYYHLRTKNIAEAP